MSTRLDVALTQLKLAPSRSKAQELIRSGSVEVNVQGEWRTVEDVSFTLEIDVDNLANKSNNPSLIRIKPNEILKYVSRGGLKLQGALEHCALNVKGMICLDVGQSTGGFTDCLLAQGAQKVIGLDVGHDQLHHSLVSHPQVVSYSGVNIRDSQQMADLKIPFDKIQLCVVDVSFISLKMVFPELKRWLLSGTQILALVKPQFELEAKNLNKNGIVKDDLLLQSVRDKIHDLALENGLKILDYFVCDIKGQDGNQEFFIYAKV